MATKAPDRKLAAILLADVVGYSCLMESDENGTHKRLQTLYQALIEPKIVAGHGRVDKRIGDGILVEFRSVVDALNCAIDVQGSVVIENQAIPQDQQIKFRIGINLGDVIVKDVDIYGDQPKDP